MQESILNSIKSMLGPGIDDDHFDEDLIVFVNGVFSELTQIGVGPEKGFAIGGPDAFWAEYMENDPKIEMVKTYIYTKVRLRFDPPQSSSVIQLMQQDAKEMEWRLNVAAES